jgi:hypothetical protein
MIKSDQQLVENGFSLEQMEKKEDSGLLKKNSNSFVELFVDIQFSIFNLLIQNLRFQINCFIEFFLRRGSCGGQKPLFFPNSGEK